MNALYPPDDDVIRSAAEAIAEARRHIDHQAKDVESLDAKATAIFTATSAGAGLVVSRVVSLTTDEQRLAAGVAVIVVAVLLISAAQVLRPRNGFSYGANPRDLVALVDRESHKTALLSLADSLVLARERNVVYLSAKQDWYERTLRGVAAAGISIAWLSYTGAIK